MDIALMILDIAFTALTDAITTVDDGIFYDIAAIGCTLLWDEVWFGILNPKKNIIFKKNILQMILWLL